MKHLMFITASLCSLGACAQIVQHAEAPALVVNAFQSQFPKARDIEWEQKGDVYEVEFETGLTGHDHEVLIDGSGKTIYHKQEVTSNDLPSAVLQNINKEFAGYYLDDIEKIEERDKTSYVVELKKASQEWKATFDEKGTLLVKIAD